MYNVQIARLYLIQPRHLVVDPAEHPSPDGHVSCTWKPPIVDRQKVRERIAINLVDAQRRDVN